MLKMRSELAFLLIFYLEPILMARGIGRGHSIELLRLIRVLNLPAAGWHQFKSRRNAIFQKAIHELRGMTTSDGSGIDVQVRQGLNTGFPAGGASDPVVVSLVEVDPRGRGCPTCRVSV